MTVKEAIKWFRESPFYHKNHEPFNMAIKALEQEPKTGHWIYQEGYVPYKWKCNQCSVEFKTDFNYCPNCGAKMEEQA